MLTLERDVIDAGERARVRAALDAFGWQRACIADRLQLETSSLADPLVDQRTARAAAIVGAPVERISFRWLRLRYGDYQLTKADARDRPPGPHVELVADLSERATGEAEVVYSDGRTLPQLPGAVAVVARDAAVLRWQRHLSLRVGDAVVHRLLVSLAPKR